MILKQKFRYYLSQVHCRIAAVKDFAKAPAIETFSSKVADLGPKMNFKEVSIVSVSLYIS